MALIRFASISADGTVSDRRFNTVSPSIFSKTINRKIRSGCRKFLLGAFQSSKVVNDIALMIADLKMARPDADFHFIHLTK